MSLHRRAARRDDNEPEIIAAFAAHGWHVEQMSAAGMPDLLAFGERPGKRKGTDRLVHLVDVKGHGKKATPAQEEKWKALAEKGIPVYVARTEEDVAAIVAGTADAWVPEANARRVRSLSASVAAPAPAAETFAPPGQCALLGCNDDAASGLWCLVHSPCRCTREQPCAACSAPPVVCSVPKCYQDVPCPRHGIQRLVR